MLKLDRTGAKPQMAFWMLWVAIWPNMHKWAELEVNGLQARKTFGGIIKELIWFFDKIIIKELL